MPACLPVCLSVCLCLPAGGRQGYSESIVGKNSMDENGVGVGGVDGSK